MYVIKLKRPTPMIRTHGVLPLLGSWGGLLLVPISSSVSKNLEFTLHFRSYQIKTSSVFRIPLSVYGPVAIICNLKYAIRDARGEHTRQSLFYGTFYGPSFLGYWNSVSEHDHFRVVPHIFSLNDVLQ